MKLWKGRFQKEADPKTNDFNSSISVDSRMYREDIEGSMAHATMLGACGIIEKGESEKIVEGLQGILADLDSGALMIDPDAEDIHTFVEGELTARIGDAGKRLHTARSRNDQVALDVRLTLRKDCAAVQAQLKDFVKVLCHKAEQYAATVMPGYTHMQRAQPITFGHHLMAYAEMFQRDLARLKDAAQRVAPPEHKRDGKPEDDGDRKAGERLPERHADMVKEAAVRCKICERRRNAGRGAHDEGIHPAAGGDQFPQSQEQREDADAQRPDEGKILFAPP